MQICRAIISFIHKRIWTIKSSKNNNLTFIWIVLHVQSGSRLWSSSIGSSEPSRIQVHVFPPAVLRGHGVKEEPDQVQNTDLRVEDLCCEGSDVDLRPGPWAAGGVGESCRGCRHFLQCPQPAGAGSELDPGAAAESRPGRGLNPAEDCQGPAQGPWTCSTGRWRRDRRTGLRLCRTETSTTTWGTRSVQYLHLYFMYVFFIIIHECRILLVIDYLYLWVMTLIQDVHFDSGLFCWIFSLLIRWKFIKLGKKLNKKWTKH